MKELPEKAQIITEKKYVEELTREDYSKVGVILLKERINQWKIKILTMFSKN